MNPKAPISNKWDYSGEIHDAATNTKSMVYRHENLGLSVLSSIDPAGNNGELYYHISITKGGLPCSTRDMKIALKHFQMMDAEREVTSRSHKAAHFFMPVVKVVQA